MRGRSFQIMHPLAAVPLPLIFLFSQRELPFASRHNLSSYILFGQYKIEILICNAEVNYLTHGCTDDSILNRIISLQTSLKCRHLVAASLAVRCTTHR